MKTVLLIKYGELALRKGNRALFERKLADTLRGLVGDPAIRVAREQGRLLIEDTRGDLDTAGVIAKIRRVFGITAICPCLKSEDRSLEALCNMAHTLLEGQGLAQPTTFRVETKRADKQYPMLSQAISAAVGHHLLAQMPHLSVDLHHPQLTLWVEVRTAAYVYTQAVQGQAGLPYGASGKGVLLLSGGIDSPVAGYLMAKRGVEIVPVYFHAPPHTSERARDKVLDLTRRLCDFTGATRLYVVPFTELQHYIYKQLPEPKMTLFLKRAMLHVAARIAAAEGAHCLIVGDSVGQVASQTLQSIAAVDSAATLTEPEPRQFPVLRPLAAMDKQQIIGVAQQIGTYDISIRPYEDCCTLFVPKHPEHKPSAKAIASIENRHRQLPVLYDQAAAQAERVTLP